MYIIIKSDEANHLETKLHKMSACISEIVDVIHNAKHVSHMPEEYRHSGFDTKSEHYDHDIENRRRMDYDRHYAPHDSYHEPYRERDFEDRRRGRY